MKTKISLIYKHLAMIAFLTLFYPILNLIGHIFTIKQSTILLQFGLIVLAGMIGFLIDQIHFSRKIFERLTIIFTGAALVVSFILTNLRFSWYEIAIFTVGALVAYILGCHLAKAQYMNILTESNFLRISIIYVVSTLYLWIVNFKYNPVFVIALYLFIVITYIIVRNHSHIENLMLRRNYSKDYLPEKIRSYNLTLLAVVFAVFLILFLCFGGLFQNILSPVGDILRKIAGAIRASGTGADLKPDSLLIGPDYEINMEQYGEVPAGSSVVPNIIFSIMAVVLISLFIYYFKDKILEALQNLIAKINDALRRLFRNISKNKSEAMVEEETEEYVDIDQAISKDDNTVQKELPQKTQRRNWKKAYKNYLKSANSPQKYETGYLLAVEGLKINGANIKKSHTTFEIADVSKDLVLNDDCLNSTVVYNELLYGKKEFNTKNMHFMDSLLLKIHELFKEKSVKEKETETKKEVNTAAEKQKRFQEHLNDQFAGENNRYDKVKKQNVLAGVGKMIVFGVIGIVLIVFLLSLFTKLVVG